MVKERLPNKELEICSSNEWLVVVTVSILIFLMDLRADDFVFFGLELLLTLKKISTWNNIFYKLTPFFDFVLYYGYNFDKIKGKNIENLDIAIC